MPDRDQELGKRSTHNFRKRLTDIAWRPAGSKGGNSSGDGNSLMALLSFPLSGFVARAPQTEQGRV